MFRSWKVESVVGVLVGGAVLALLPFVFLVNMSSVPGELFVNCIFVGAVNGAVFWAVAVCRSNNRLQIDVVAPRD